MLRGCSEQVLGAGDMTWTVPRCHGLCQAGEEKRGQNWEMPPARGGLFHFILSGSNTSPGRLSSRLARRAGGGFEAESCQAPSETEARVLAVGGDSQVPYIICSAREVNTGHCHCQQEAPRAEQPARVTSWCVGWGWGIPLHQDPPPWHPFRARMSIPGCWETEAQEGSRVSPLCDPITPGTRPPASRAVSSGPGGLPTLLP